MGEAPLSFCGFIYINHVLHSLFGFYNACRTHVAKKSNAE